MITDWPGYYARLVLWHTVAGVYEGWLTHFECFVVTGYR